MAELDGLLKKFSDHVIPASKVAELVKKLKVTDEKALMVHLASNYSELAQAPVSNFKVGIVGREKETGDLLLGGNLEFLDVPLGLTIHAEQFLFARAFSR